MYTIEDFKPFIGKDIYCKKDYMNVNIFIFCKGDFYYLEDAVQWNDISIKVYIAHKKGEYAMEFFINEKDTEVCEHFELITIGELRKRKIKSVLE